MLQGVETQGGVGGGVGMIEDAKDAALLPELVVIERVGRDHL